MDEGYLKYLGVLLCLFAIAAILPPVSASYSMYSNLNHIAWGGGSCTPDLNGTTIATAHDGDVFTNAEVSTCEARAYFLNNWTMDYCTFIQTRTGTENQLVSTSGNATSPNSTALIYNTLTTLSPKKNTGGINPYLPNTQYVVFSSGGVGAYYLGEWECYGTSSEVDPPLSVANFTGSPLTGTVPLTVSFTDTSTNLTGTETWNWSVSPAPGVSITTPAAQDTQMTFGAIGNYTITHGLSNAYTSSINTKTDYIYVYNSTSTTTLHVTAINALNANPIHGAQVNLYDVQNTSWSNTTTTEGTGTITALNSHTINAYASASGFADGDKLGIPVTNTYDSILLFPTNITNVIEGNVTLFVSVFDSADHSKPIVGAGVTVITPTTAQGGFTNSGGSAQFAVPNKTTVLIDVSATGYQGATQSVYTGTGSGGSASVTTTIYLSKKTVTPTAVITTLPGGGTVVPTKTLIGACTSEDDMSPECQASLNEYSMGWLSQHGLMLIQFFVVCFLIFMLKGMGR